MIFVLARWLFPRGRLILAAHYEASKNGCTLRFLYDEYPGMVRLLMTISEAILRNLIKISWVTTQQHTTGLPGLQSHLLMMNLKKIGSNGAIMPCNSVHSNGTPHGSIHGNITMSTTGPVENKGKVEFVYCCCVCSSIPAAIFGHVRSSFLLS